MEIEKDIWDIIAAVLNETATTEEQKQVALWLNEGEENKKIFNSLQNARIKKVNNSADVRNKIFSRVQKDILENSYIRRIRVWKYAVAASVAIIISLSFLLIFPTKHESEIADIEISCPKGNTSKVTLPDGSIVHLNSGSKLTYPARFASESRNISLIGEAFFEVKKDPAHPFVVTTGQVKVKVFGTSFNVRNYPEDRTIETTLREGLVAVYQLSDTSFSNGLSINPNQQIVYIKDIGNFIKRDVDAELSSLWLEGKFYFEKEELGSIVKKLERNYNVSININSEKLNKLVFTGLIDKRLNVFQTLDIMRRYNAFNYRVNRDSIIITDK